MAEKLNVTQNMTDWTFLCADLCFPVEIWVIHHPVVRQVGLSVEQADKLINAFIMNIIVTRRISSETAERIKLQLTLSGTFSCTEPEHTQRLRVRAAAARCRCQRTQELQ